MPVTRTIVKLTFRDHGPSTVQYELISKGRGKRGVGYVRLEDTFEVPMVVTEAELAMVHEPAGSTDRMAISGVRCTCSNAFDSWEFTAGVDVAGQASLSTAHERVAFQVPSTPMPSGGPSTPPGLGGTAAAVATPRGPSTPPDLDAA
jgi:hypothetical protein